MCVIVITLTQADQLNKLYFSGLQTASIYCFTPQYVATISYKELKQIIIITSLFAHFILQ